MDLWRRVLLGLAGLSGAAGVAAAAVSAHLAGGALLETAAHFLIMNAAALVGIGALVLAADRGRVLLLAGGSLIAAGTVLFCGDLAARAITSSAQKWGTAPFGGGAMIAGWLMVAVGGLLSRRA